MLFFERALECAAALPDPWFHTTVVRGLPPLYLSDPESRTQNIGEAVPFLLMAGGTETVSMYRACILLRRFGRL